MRAIVPIAAAVVATLFECGPNWTKAEQCMSPPEHWRVCVDLPEETRAQAVEAVQSWHRATRGVLELEAVASPIARDCDVAIAEVDPSDTTPRGTCGWVPSVGADRIWLVRGCYERHARAVVLHEMGHVLGADHASGIMSLELDHGAECPDQMAVVQVAAWHRLPTSLFAYCYR